MSKKYLLFSILIFIIIASKFIWIDRFPPGMQHDEIEYVLSSKTYQLFGTDISGAHFPASLFKTNTSGKISPIPSLFFAPIWNVAPMNMMTVRIAYSLLNVITSFAFGWFIYILFKKKSMAFLGIILFLLNPWSLFLSRQAIDAVFALIFYLLGVTVLLKGTKKSYIISLLLFILGFYSYNGAKLLLLPIVGITLTYKFIDSDIKKKIVYPYLIYIALIIGIIIYFVAISHFIPDSIYNARSSEISFLNSDYLAGNTDTLRSQTISTPLNTMFINKATYAISNISQSYFVALSPQKLFTTGEVFKYHGYFYIIDILFLLIGLLALYKKNRNASLLLIGLCSIAPLITASSLNGQSILNRSFLLLPILLTWITYGIHYSYTQLAKRINNRIVILLMFVPYLFLYSNLLFTYFVQLPIHEHGFYQVSTRVLAKYASLEKINAKKIIIVSKEPRQLYLETIFFSDSEKQISLLKERQTFSERDIYTIDNIDFVKGCPKNISQEFIYVVEKDILDCIPNKAFNYLIIDQLDAGNNFGITKGMLCSNYSLTRWRYPHLISDYAIEEMDIKQFCERWIASY